MWRISITLCSGVLSCVTLGLSFVIGAMRLIIIPISEGGCEDSRRRCLCWMLHPEYVLNTYGRLLGGLPASIWGSENVTTLTTHLLIHLLLFCVFIFFLAHGSLVAWATIMPGQESLNKPVSKQKWVSAVGPYFQREETTLNQSPICPQSFSLIVLGVFETFKKF